MLLSYSLSKSAPLRVALGHSQAAEGRSLLGEHMDSSVSGDLDGDSKPAPLGPGLSLSSAEELPPYGISSRVGREGVASLELYNNTRFDSCTP